MAEEKSTKTTKTTKKEEVKVEKRFCTKCGKELKGDEVCTCEEAKKSEAISVNTEALKGLGKGFLDTIINMYKKPVDTLDEEVAKKDIKASMIMLVAIAISYGLCMMGGFTSILDIVGARSINVSSYVDIPYFKIFLYVTIIYFILSFIPIAAAFIVAKITGNSDFDFKKSIRLYATSMAPTIFTNLLMAILYYLNILSWVGAVIGGVIGIACFFNYILGYLRCTDIKDNKKAYALTSLVVIWVVTFVIALFVFVGSMATDINPTMKKDPSSYFDFYN